MSHFYGVLKGARGETTRASTEAVGLTTIAASWQGAVRVQLWHDGFVDRFVVTQIPWQGAGVEQEVATGILGKEAP